MGRSKGNLAVRGSVLATVRTMSWYQKCWLLRQWSVRDSIRRQEVDDYGLFDYKDVVQSCPGFLSRINLFLSYIFNEAYRLP